MAARGFQNGACFPNIFREANLPDAVKYGFWAHMVYLMRYDPLFPPNRGYHDLAEILSISQRDRLVRAGHVGGRGQGFVDKTPVFKGHEEQRDMEKKTLRSSIGLENKIDPLTGQKLKDRFPR